MLHHVATLVLAVDHHEPSKTPFYLAGGLLACWAVGLGFAGIRLENFPGSAPAQRGVMAVSLLLVALALAMALISS